MEAPRRSRMIRLGRRPTGASALPPSGRPDWAECRPGWIEAALRRALSRPGGGWFVFAASRAISPGPALFQVAGRELVAWRTGGVLRVAPDSCPHLGASLSKGRIDRAGCLVCPWHGLALGDAPHGRWRPLPCLDDGVLAWVRLSRAEGALGSGEEPTDAPIVTARPAAPLSGVIRVDANCEPEDVLANRLDPWHGVHFHPHSFGRLRVIAQDDDSITARVTYRVLGRLGVEVDARFCCPDPRTIAMTIVDGEGLGSVVETHASPIAAGRTAIIEATLATSGRPGFWLARKSARAIRPLIERAAARLWRDDAAYAERRYSQRVGRTR